MYLASLVSFANVSEPQKAALARLIAACYSRSIVNVGIPPAAPLGMGGNYGADVLRCSICPEGPQPDRRAYAKRECGVHQ